MIQILDELDEDLNLTPMNLEKKIYKIPALHAKYQKHFLKEKVRLAKLEETLNQMYRKKYHYYTFEYEEKLESAKEIQFHIYGDDEYSKLKRSFENQKALVQTLEYTMKKIGQLTFDVKNIVELRKHLDGC